MPIPSTSERDFITVVSGIPRSGTSMMLRMLVAGGMPILTDGVRVADEANPHGYLEWERVKTLKHDTSWVAGAVGKGVKVIYYWLYDLPLDFRYRVLFMRRDLDEVLASQAAMLRVRNVADQSPDDERMKCLFQNDLREIDEWMSSQPSLSVLDVDYGAVLARPVEQAKRVDEFLGRTLDTQAMAAMVDTALYRRRSN